jgi:hypothetical protein
VHAAGAKFRGSMEQASEALAQAIERTLVAP